MGVQMVEGIVPWEREGMVPWEKDGVAHEVALEEMVPRERVEGKGVRMVSVGVAGRRSGESYIEGQGMREEWRGEEEGGRREYQPENLSKMQRKIYSKKTKQKWYYS